MSPHNQTPDRPAISDASFNYGVIVLVFAILALAFVASLNLASGRAPQEDAYKWMAILPLAPALWQLVGFFGRSARDGGLGVSAFGWLLLSFAFWVLYRTPEQATSALFWILLLLSAALLALGAILSLTYARNLPADE